MAVLFDVTTPDNTVLLGPPDGGDGRARHSAALFTVTYIGEEPVWATAQPLADDPQAQAWFSLKQPARRQYQPGDTAVYTVLMRVPPGALSGLYRFRLGVSEEANPDEHHASSPPVAFSVPYDAPRQNMAWLWLLLAAVLIGVLVAVFLLTRPGPPPQLAETPETSLSPAVATDGRNLYVAYRAPDLRLYLATYDTITQTWTTTDEPIRYELDAEDFEDETFTAQSYASPSLVWRDGALYLMYQARQGIRGGYVVREGDTLESIAALVGRDRQTLVTENEIEGDQVRPGEVLTIPNRGLLDEAIEITVQPGDTLPAIARRLGRTVEEIIRANGISNPNLLFVGQTLIVPARDIPAEGGFRLLRYSPESRLWTDLGLAPSIESSSPVAPSLGYDADRWQVSYPVGNVIVLTFTVEDDGPLQALEREDITVQTGADATFAPVWMMRQDIPFNVYRTLTFTQDAPIDTLVAADQTCDSEFCPLSLTLELDGLDGSTTQRREEPAFAAAPLQDGWHLIVLRQNPQGDQQGDQLLAVQIPPDTGGEPHLLIEPLILMGEPIAEPETDEAEDEAEAEDIANDDETTEAEEVNLLRSAQTPGLVRVGNTLYMLLVQEGKLRLVTRPATRIGDWSQPQVIMPELLPTPLPPTPTPTATSTPTATATPEPTAALTPTSTVAPG